VSGKRILLLGGIGEALAIARRLGPGHLYSLAGLGKVPDDLACQVRVGGYGGAEGLADFIAGQGYDLLLDATHPYAAQISRNAARAAQLAGVPCWALRRPGWQPGPGDDWSTSAKFPNISSGPCAVCRACRAMRAPKCWARAGPSAWRASASCSRAWAPTCW
jgi:precorrin-6A/cobalt-precorrin-6A reductase